MNLKFHWMLPKSGEVANGVPQTPLQAARYRIESSSQDSPAARPEMGGWVHFAQHAEEAGIDSVLVALNRYEPDPLVISCALGRATKRLKFIAA
ncbi:MAG TPA: LLM class flavin-dependent oxidoreductase, partial [Pyrinomonadaceae bacterium]|nr:LLM class flavin-dependent oxidoreductase [Pyrinomonadaceae bacterium]